MLALKQIVVCCSHVFVCVPDWILRQVKVRFHMCQSRTLQDLVMLICRRQWRKPQVAQAASGTTVQKSSTGEFGGWSIPKFIRISTFKPMIIQKSSTMNGLKRGNGSQTYNINIWNHHICGGSTSINQLHWGSDKPRYQGELTQNHISQPLGTPAPQDVIKIYQPLWSSFIYFLTWFGYPPATILDRTGLPKNSRRVHFITRPATVPIF